MTQSRQVNVSMVNPASQCHKCKRYQNFWSKSVSVWPGKRTAQFDPFTNINDILGILLSFALLPYIVFGEFDHGRKFYQAIFAIMIWLALMITLIVLFYNPNPLYLEWAHRFTCVPPIGEAEGEILVLVALIYRCL